ncbi:MAG: ral L-amino acid transport system permease protein [Methylobacteriaceae bacterium]|jgi:general L-amino acid transport system permease protein|nr:ral L-amino acid transport system permease protein [Methylobacteriaceae bacterium]
MSAIQDSLDETFFVRTEAAPEQPPPLAVGGIVGSVRANLFRDIGTSILTLVAATIAIWFGVDIVRYMIIDAVWSAPDGAACRAPGAGACWAYVWRKLPYFIYGSYPVDERWRVDVTLAIGAVLIAWLLWPSSPRKGTGALLFFVLYPILAFVLLYGVPALGLPQVPTNLWGGVFVSLLVALVGMVFSLPGGVLLALGRRSRLPAVRIASIGFIEFVRGVPLITVLFMANTMLPLFVPEQFSPDRLVRPLIGVALFASAYMAEVVRGGLNAIPRGQFEAAQALGLRYPQMMRLIVLPQALTIVIPGVVNTFIGLFKDTTLVAIVGIFDFLRTVDTARLDPEWAGPTISTTGYVFAAMFYFVFCFGMSRYSLAMERRLAAGRNR